ncbi:hypothetical protein JN531_001390 [Flagellatimonas centrodinii]|uniref:hypothetical protein n=1 Tax=Flagellatimonas centrodinii TaxID=2806210 RepID=UPI001FEF5A63|nr:hypothetical protein [Flagellatimonas centrodinii]ULQ46952.1 hypothetical protein JN531_001390 [Flagellatimonas centrodinii]
MWDYFERGGKRAIGIWHRRAGKDDVCLHLAAVKAFERPATYWHMLPEYSQGRKAIWAAINPHTGKRRIDEAFPPAVRDNTNEQEMFIRFKNGSTWQVVGSDRFNSTVGSPPAGLVLSEWALSNPAAWAYLSPILNENGGWAAFITTPRGKNHAHSTLQMARQSPDWFSEVLDVRKTGAISLEAVEEQRREYHGIYGAEAGDALIEQEYFCSFESAILGAYYGRELARLHADGRVGKVDADDAFPIHAAWDLGYSDDTSIWFYQVVSGEIRVIDFHSSNGHTVDWYADLVKSKTGGNVGTLWLPHDAKAKTLAGNGRSIEQQLAAHFGRQKIRIVPRLSLQDGIQAVRLTLPQCWFNEETTMQGLSALAQYQREWDDERKCFRDRPRHDWTSHPADAFRMLAIAWRAEPPPKPRNPPPRWETDLTINELIAANRRKRLRDD